MKILHINTTASRGGAAQFARHLHLWLCKSGHESRLLVGRDPSDVNDGILSLHESRSRFLLNVLGYRVLGREGLLNRGIWKRALADVGEVDVVHIHNAHGYYMPAEILADLLSMPVVWTLHDFWLATGGLASPEVARPWGNGYPIEWIDRSMVRRQFLAHLVSERNPVLISPTQSSAEKLKELGLLASNLHVVPHGIFDSVDATPRCTRQELRDSLGWRPDTHVFVFASSTVDNKSKGFGVFLSALSKLPKDRKWIAFVAGGSDDEAKRMCQRQGISNVRFAGSIANQRLRECFRACDTYVTATFSESYGLTVVEALGEGARVVCSDLPVLREVSDGHANYFSVGDIGALADCLMKELERIDDVKGVSRSAEIRRRFSKDEMVASYVRLYSLAVSQKSASLKQ